MKLKLLYFLAAGCAVLVLAFHPKWTVDDAYITYRYAENLAHHGQFVWNVHEDPVEGYTGIALPILLAGAIELGLSPDLTSKALGFISFFAILLALNLCLQRLRVRESIRAITFLLVAGCPLMFTHATSGLETLAFSAAITFSLWSLLGCLGSEQKGPERLRQERLLSFFLLITSLIRPEGVALAICYVVAMAWRRWKEGGRALASFALQFSMVYVLPGLIYFVWRCWYYGRLLPNTFYAKRYPGIINWTTVRTMGLFLYTYLTIPLVVASALFILKLVMAKRRESESEGGHETSAAQSGKPAFVANLIFLALIAAQYIHSVLLMNYGFRFYMPYMPIMLVGMAVVADRSVESLARARASGNSLLRPLGAGLVLLGVVQFGVYVYQFRFESTRCRQYAHTLDTEHYRAAAFLKEVMPMDEWIAVYVDGGAVPYRTGLKTVDFGKLNDGTLARNNFSAPQIADYFFSRNLGAAVITSRNWYRPSLDEHLQAIVDDPRFGQYVLAKKYRTDQNELPSTYYQFVYLRKDLFEKLTPSQKADSPIHAPTG